MAGKGVANDGRTVEFFFRNGQMFATEVEVCSFRNREYPESFTDRIQSNTFTIGIKHDHEALIFVATEKAREVRLVVEPSVFGERKTIELSLGQTRVRSFGYFHSVSPTGHDANCHDTYKNLANFSARNAIDLFVMPAGGAKGATVAPEHQRRLAIS